jgi:hypothetical protein
MKWILACLVGVCLLSPIDLHVSRADVIPGPVIPERKAQREKTATYPVYASAAGVVAVALSGSFVALRVIRKRNGKQPG